MIYILYYINYNIHITYTYKTLTYKNMYNNNNMRMGDKYIFSI